MTTRSRSACALVVVAAVAAIAPRPARASKADAFAGKVEPVSGQLFDTTGRLELTPVLDFSVNDAFFTKQLAGAKLGYHVTRWLAIDASYVTLVHASPTGSATTCTSTGGCSPASQAQLYQVPGYLESIAGLELSFEPVYGKVNLFAEQVVHLDFAILAGGDWITYRDVLSTAQATAGETPGTGSTFGGHLGLGVRIFFTQALALWLDVKEYAYPVDVPNVATGSGSSSNWQFQTTFGVGLSIFFPFHNRAVP